MVSGWVGRVRVREAAAALGVRGGSPTCAPSPHVRRALGKSELDIEARGKRCGEAVRTLGNSEGSCSKQLSRETRECGADRRFRYCTCGCV